MFTLFTNDEYTTIGTLSIYNTRFGYKPFGEDFNLLRLDFEAFLHRLTTFRRSGF